MELREITTFLHVAQLKSFSKAAKLLGYSQAAVTIQIKQLEEELGVHLFDRIGKQTTLTHQGSVFYEYASSILQNLAQAKDALSEPTQLTGHLCIGTIESICSSIFPCLLREFHKRYPGISVSIVTDSPDVLLEQMNRNAIDIVYFLDKRIYDPKWNKVLEEPEEIVFVAHRDHPIAAYQHLELDQLLSQPFILTERNASYRLMLDQYLTPQNKAIRPFLESSSTDFIIDMLHSNMGVSFLPYFTVREDIKKGRLHALKVEAFHMRSWRQIVYHKDKWVSREMRAFLNLVQEMENSVK